MILKALAASAMLAVAASASAAPGLVARLAWLQGCWQVQGSEAGTVEQWTAAAGGTLFGLSRTVKGGKTSEFEFLHVREVEPGVLAYIAQPSGRPPTPFPLLRSTDNEFVFENLNNDFPQRVIYRRDGPNAVVARIEGMRKGVPRGIDFPMKRIACDPA